MRLLAASMLVLLSFGAVAETGEVTIPSGDLTLRARLVRPAGEGPFAAVVALHDCAGLSEAAGALAPRYQEWTDPLVQAGFAVLLVDSYGSRKLGNQCAARDRLKRLLRERQTDASAAREWLQTQPWAKPDRISVMGWGSGSTALLWVVRPRAGRPEPRDFRSAIAVQPNCRRLSEAAWSARIPTLIIKATDDRSSTRACEQMVADARGRSALATLAPYAGSLQNFEHQRGREGFELSFSGRRAGRNATRDATSRAEALRRVTEWLNR